VEAAGHGAHFASAKLTLPILIIDGIRRMLVLVARISFLLSVLMAASAMTRAEEAPSSLRDRVAGQLASIWNSAPSMSSILDAIKANNNDFTNYFTQEVATTLPILEALKYEISSLCVQGLPPKAKLRLVSETILDLDKVAAASGSESSGILASLIVYGAKEGKKIQKLMNFQTAVVDVDFLPPSVRMSFLRGKAEKGTGNELSVEALDIACGREFGGR